jgi:hypothetical protein
MRIVKGFIRSEVTTKEVAFTVLLAVAAYAYQGMTAGFSLANVSSFLVPAIWAVCACSIGFTWKAGFALHAEDLKKWEGDEPVIHGAPKRTRPSWWRVVPGCVALSVLFAVVAGGTLYIPQSKQGGIEQRSLPKGKLPAITRALLAARGGKVLLSYDATTEARGFAAQIKDVLVGWEVIGVAERVPPSKPILDNKMIVKGKSLNDPRIIAIQSAFAIAGYDVRYVDGGQNSLSIWLEF